MRYILGIVFRNSSNTVVIDLSYVENRQIPLKNGLDFQGMMRITKRAHKKTRTGCQSCKARRVKCDEIQPKCTSCSIRELECNYPTQTRSIAITLSTEDQSCSLIRNFTEPPNVRSFSSEIIVGEKVSLRTFGPSLSTTTNLHDMRLFHHYCTVTIETLGVNQPLSTSAIGVWQKEVPRLAFEHAFLMDNLLALASAHMNHVAPRTADYQLTALYQDKALRAFREAVAQLSADNFLPVLVTSTLLSPSSLFFHRNIDEARLWSPDWMVMHTGVGAILRSAAWKDVLESSIGPIFQVQHPDPAMSLIPSALQGLLDLIVTDARIASYHDVLFESVTCLGQVYGGLAQNGMNQATTIDIMRWPFAIPSQFMQLAKEQEPHALIVLAYFIILFELLPQLWWVSDVARHDVEIISAVLGSQWENFLDMPMAVVQVKDRNSILDLLLGQLFDINTAHPACSKLTHSGVSEGFVALKDLDMNYMSKDEVYTR